MYCETISFNNIDIFVELELFTVFNKMKIQLFKSI